MISHLVAIHIGALLGRHKGGFGGKYLGEWYGATCTRIIVSSGMTGFLIFISNDWWLLGLIPCLWVGFLFGWFDAADLGRDHDRSRLKEAGLMALRGLILTAPAGLYLLALGYHWWLIPVGLLALPLGYEAGHRTPIYLPNLHRGMEIAEAYTGAWLMELMVIVVSQGPVGYNVFRIFL